MGTDSIAAPVLETVRRIHLVGIGGSGMSSLAQLLVGQGKQVSGSDQSGDSSDYLTALGVSTFVGHDAEQVGQAELLIVSAAVPADNSEVLEARRRGLPVISHAQALGRLMATRTGLAVAGTHGKTTTSAMLGFILAEAGLDPTVLVGGRMLNIGSGARLGSGPHLVVEADEYDRRFLELRPMVAIVTGIEPDHLDYFRDFDEIVEAFRLFGECVLPRGCVVTSADEPTLVNLELPRRRLTFGLDERADWRVVDFVPHPGGGCRFDAVGPAGGTPVELGLSGRHNACNAVAAIAAATEIGVGPMHAARALAGFMGTERRFETIWQCRGMRVVDDYAHHPTAVRATLEAACETHAGRIWAVFQPHTSNRVAELFDEFVTCFQDADRLTLLPIYQPAGREGGGRSVSAADLAAAISHPPARLVDSFELAEQELAAEARPGDLILFMGAGDVTRLSRALAERLSRRTVEAGPRS